MAGGVCKYDVFISYSRDDYIRSGRLVKDSVISKILALFDAHGISYWIDKKGVYSGTEFMSVVAQAIGESKMMVFVSSEHSNRSKWTPGEIVEALNKDMTIIPIRIDGAEYHQRFRIALNSLDFIDYVRDPETALHDLLRAVNRVLEEYEIAETKKRIDSDVQRFKLLEKQQNTIVQGIILNNKKIGVNHKDCPVCQSQLPLEDAFCSKCGWRFHPLEQLSGDVSFLDGQRLAISEAVWKSMAEPAGSSVQIKALTRQLDLKQKECDSRREDWLRLNDKLQLVQKESNAEIDRLRIECRASQDRNKALQEELLRLKTLLSKSTKEEVPSRTAPKTETRPKSGSQSSASEVPPTVLSLDYARLMLVKFADECNVTPHFVFSTSPVSSIDLSRFLQLVQKQFGVTITPKELKKCNTVIELRAAVLDKLFQKRG